jgi:tetratricopeptide (TPR) repeat protein
MSKWQRMSSVNLNHPSSPADRPARIRRGPFALLRTVLSLVIFFAMTRIMFSSQINDRDTDAPNPSEAARSQANMQEREAAVQTQPDNPWAYQQRGVAYYNLGMYDKAIADLSKTISMAPKAEEAHVYRARCYLLQKNYEKAIPDYEATLSSKHPYFGYRGRGICYYQLGEYQKAADDFTSALEIRPRDREILNDRAMAYQKLHLTDLANSDLKRRDDVNGPPILKDIAPFIFPSVNHVSKYWLH